MKKVIAGISLMTVVLAISAVPAFATNDKVYVCHWANGNPHIIHISENALDGHFDNHGNPVPGHEFDLNFGSNLSNDEEESCSGRIGPQGPQGPAGPEGPKGEDGEDGEDGHNPELTILCFPGAGLGVIVDYDGESQLPDGSHILADGAICPLSGEDGADGENGVDGEDGAVGPQGPAGQVGLTGAVGPAGPAGPVTEVTTTTTTAPPAATPAPAATELPKTGLGNWLWMAGAAALLAGIMMSLVGRRSNA